MDQSLTDATNKTKLLIYELLTAADNCPLPVRDLIKILPAVTKAERDAYAATTPAPAPDESPAAQLIADLKEQLAQAHIQTTQAQTRAERLQAELETRTDRLQRENQRLSTEVEQLKASQRPRPPPLQHEQQRQPTPSKAQLTPPAPTIPQGPKTLDPRIKSSSTTTTTTSATPPPPTRRSPPHERDAHRRNVRGWRLQAECGGRCVGGV
ncbi:hypothetical protein Tdes44962_MAKER06488 [Teratosphaeria destructans]|uniref:Uncharacterized protein n=1 Tax=Teratosphaeria destructans TaxID=418781 RepID=A0A9W7T1N5_9PEZI|nr:hypothetical protein Tdes44962_MAKER06488 [Teratosphaeria destructans]